MRITVRLFAGLRERAGASSVDLELPEGARVADALEELRELTGGVPVVMAVNQEYAGAGTALSQGDEVALIPPVSGGAAASGEPGGWTGAPAEPGPIHVRVTDHPLSQDDLVARVRDERAGAVVTFLGVTREVSHLDYEAYVPMAERRIAEILRAATERHGLCAAAAEHRIGAVPLSEPSVVIAVSAPHREAAFAGAREVIDTIKAEAPIWKREEGEWVAGSLPGDEGQAEPGLDARAR